jgi:hypothetical protein
LNKIKGIIMDKKEAVYRTALQLVEHFTDCLQMEKRGVHSRIFPHLLNPEQYFVSVGQSQEVIDGAKSHVEHIVPCVVIIKESFKLIEDNFPKDEIARLIVKHWKIAFISKDQAKHLDTKAGADLKNTMPDNWDYKTGSTFARLDKAGIKLQPL